MYIYYILLFVFSLKYLQGSCQVFNKIHTVLKESLSHKLKEYALAKA